MDNLIRYCSMYELNLKNIYFSIDRFINLADENAYLDIHIKFGIQFIYMNTFIYVFT